METAAIDTEVTCLCAFNLCKLYTFFPRGEKFYVILVILQSEHDIPCCELEGDLLLRGLRAVSGLGNFPVGHEERMVCT